MGKFVIKKRKDGQYQFNLQAGNGQVILTSQGYKAKASCMNGIKSVMQNASDPKRFELKEAKNGKPMFNLIATNGQVIGTSEQYESVVGRDNGIASVSKNAPDATIDDQSME